MIQSPPQPSGAHPGDASCDGAEHAPTLPSDASLADIVDLALASDDHAWVVLLDPAGRPVTLIERTALLLGEPFEVPATRLPPAPTREEGRRLAYERPVEQQHVPLICCGPDERYIGIVPVERLGEPPRTGARRR